MCRTIYINHSKLTEAYFTHDKMSRYNLQALHHTHQDRFLMLIIYHNNFFVPEMHMNSLVTHTFELIENNVFVRS